MFRKCQSWQPVAPAELFSSSRSPVPFTVSPRQSVSLCLTQCPHTLYWSWQPWTFVVGFISLVFLCFTLKNNKQTETTTDNKTLDISFGMWIVTCHLFHWSWFPWPFHTTWLCSLQPRDEPACSAASAIVKRGPCARLPASFCFVPAVTNSTLSPTLFTLWIYRVKSCGNCYAEVRWMSSWLGLQRH